MRLFKIKNKLMFKSSNPNGTHTYAVYWDEGSKKYRAIQLTHLYEDKKALKIDKGFLKVEKFRTFKHPSGVHDEFFEKDIWGRPLYFGKNTYHKKIDIVPSSQSKRISSFAINKVK